MPIPNRPNVGRMPRSQRNRDPCRLKNEAIFSDQALSFVQSIQSHPIPEAFAVNPSSFVVRSTCHGLVGRYNLPSQAMLVLGLTKQTNIWRGSSIG